MFFNFFVALFTISREFRMIVALKPTKCHCFQVDTLILLFNGVTIGPNRTKMALELFSRTRQRSLINLQITE